MIETRPLGNLITPATTRRAGSADLPLLSMTMHGGLVDQSSKFRKRVASADTSDYKVVGRGQLVVGFPIDEGVLDFQSLYDEAIVSPAYGIWDVCDEQVHRPFLSEFLRSPVALSYYRSKLRGTTARRRSLPAEIFLGLPVPVPSTDDQRRITDTLDRTAALRVQLARERHLIDEMAASIFLATFGHPLARDSAWPRTSLEKVAVTTSGGTPDRKNPAYFGGAIPWVKSGELRAPIVTETEESLTPDGLAHSSAKLMPPGTLLLAMYGATAGAVAELGVTAATNQAVCCISPGPRVSTDYLLACLKLMSSHLLKVRAGGAQPNLSQALIRKLSMPVPPLELQLRYSKVLSHLAELRDMAKSRLETSEDLIRSTRDRAFRGAL